MRDDNRQRRRMRYTHLILPLIAILTLVLYNLLPYNSTFVEQWYSRGIFAWYRSFWDYTIGLFPFGLIYLLILAILIYLFRPIRAHHMFQSRFLNFVWRFLCLFSWGIICFYWLWAFNYKRSSFHELTSLEHAQPNQSFVYYEYCRVTDSLEFLRNQLGLELDLVKMNIDESALRHDLTKAYKMMDLPSTGRVRAVKLRPRGSLLHLSTAGVYLPFVGQGHIDAGLHPITHPFTMMHEMSHGYGWTGEDVCNFLALLGTINSDDLLIRYSGYFGYWRYLRSQIYQIDRQHFEEFYRSGPDPIMKDYMSIIAYSDRYPDIMPVLRDLFYDQYLKSHGISSGLVNYSQMIILSYDWQSKYGSLSLDSVSKAK